MNSPSSRFYWAWYWAQSVELAAADVAGSLTHEEAVQAARVEERRLMSIWGPGKAFRLEITYD